MAKNTITVRLKVRWPVLCAVLCTLGFGTLAMRLCLTTEVAE